jgi:DNA polymerase
MLVGEQPGDQEDIAGKPFVGPAGQLLDRALQAAGLDRGSLYITNAVKHFKWEPRGKRRLHKTPAQLEIDACMFWLEHEIDRVQPMIIVALGSTALKALLKTSKVSLTQMLGQEISHDAQRIIATYHPSYVLRVSGEEEKSTAFAEMVRAFSHAKYVAATAG